MSSNFMHVIGRAFAALLMVAAASIGTPVAAQECPALLSHTFPKLQDESPQSLCQYKGKVVLAVNTASYCGFTPQYEGLEKLHERYAARGLVILGFPSGDFGNQEKANNKEIAEFCFNTYGVKFPMFAKTSVRGDKANPFFAALAGATVAASSVSVDSATAAVAMTEGLGDAHRRTPRRPRRWPAPSCSSSHWRTAVRR